MWHSLRQSIGLLLQQCEALQTCSNLFESVQSPTSSEDGFLGAKLAVGSCSVHAPCASLPKNLLECSFWKIWRMDMSWLLPTDASPLFNLRNFWLCSRDQANTCITYGDVICVYAVYVGVVSLQIATNWNMKVGFPSLSRELTGYRLYGVSWRRGKGWPWMRPIPNLQKGLKIEVFMFNPSVHVPADVSGPNKKYIKSYNFENIGSTCAICIHLFQLMLRFRHPVWKRCVLWKWRLGIAFCRCEIIAMREDGVDAEDMMSNSSFNFAEECFNLFKPLQISWLCWVFLQIFRGSDGLR